MTTQGKTDAKASGMKTFAMLTDVTLCIGCEECVTACKQLNQSGDEDKPWKWQGKATDLSSTRWTTIDRTPEGRYVRVHCRHCLDPGCAAACPVSALKVTAQGAVAYDPEICMGCRYCMMACPFGMTRYEWESANPRIRKCILCYDKLTAGDIEQPACTAACPEGATIFGERDALLAEARRRIADEPGRYINHIWGEEEVGGTSVLYLSDVPLVTAGWPVDLAAGPVPELAERVLQTVPTTFLTVGAAMVGIHWVIRRRQKLAVETASADTATALDAADAEPSPQDNEETS